MLNREKAVDPHVTLEKSSNISIPTFTILSKILIIIHSSSENNDLNQDSLLKTEKKVIEKTDFLSNKKE